MVRLQFWRLWDWYLFIAITCWIVWGRVKKTWVQAVHNLLHPIKSLQLAAATGGANWPIKAT